MRDVLLVGLCTVDLVQWVTTLPAPGEKVQSAGMNVAAGGPAANAAVAVAAAGGRPTLVTGLGRHPLAALARADLEECGVRVIDLDPTRAEPPALSAVAVRESDGERTVVSRNASALAVPAAADLLDDLVAGAGAVLVDGHHPRPTLAAASAARVRRVPVVLDAGSWKRGLGELLPLVDVCACSASFAVPGAPDTVAALHELGIPVVTRTDGPRPVRWSCAPSGGRPGERTTTGEEPVTPVPARDTLGAGDVWHGVFTLGVACLGRVPGPAELPALIRAANDVAGLRVSHVGPRSWVAPVRDREETR
ncbi:Sugar or nucleoside kinase, ribokinase family [Streptoalloteichus tenebrarius]|uniref:Sugar or nucleoside kinase, ribokinase family n=1 Tax=Streptoalloteichus tenebrarius (strain ATCC 17920 / DSM 40477 / JCM 4838 / CBS 697.72 / NBRC 16177 / NCIMB 11028 / NRRL B-12390 / A12253. 1 / ISP 5477) TaxID=1933 RepID=A0ABT1I3F0_STRSD|nr:PfkB family carbohydrate kinase [Streptoalloteichus tenebrarius]MCP2262319.1 Sugar or nucleoside kinase, ribokinase family [Streptoalloteichus tenebrarius]BFF02213.1 PfkB family carbohydrate kinase [Streptoalloteichus tenebrarius]